MKKRYEKVCIVVCLYVFNDTCICPNEFSRSEFGKSLGVGKELEKASVY